MWCIKCNHDLGECICLDLQQRLESLRGVLVYKMCIACMQHYSKCVCKEPVWALSSELD